MLQANSFEKIFSTESQHPIYAAGPDIFAANDSFAKLHLMKS